MLVMLPLPPAHFRSDPAYAGSSPDGYDDPAARAARQRAAQALARDHGLSFVGEWPMPVIGVDCVVLAPAEDAEAALDGLAGDSRVAWAQPVHEYRAQAEPVAATHDDPLYPVQPAATSWHLASLHTVASGSGVTVAVIDSGVDARHVDLRGQVAWNEDFVDRRGGSAVPPAEQHGTEVAGVIAALADNRVGIAGIAPGARLMALRACWQRSDDSTVCNSLTLAQALQFAIRHEADVINLSLAGPPDRLLESLVAAALSRGIGVVSAADRSLPGGGFPASEKGVVAVADDRPGPLPAGALVAPGRDVPTTMPGDRFALASGSSLASAHVAGLMALVRQKRQHRPAGTWQLERTGSGEVDACSTVARLDPACVCGCTQASATSGTSGVAGVAK